jgi:hypothetical protein
MLLVFTKEDISSFSPSTRAELMAAAFPKPKAFPNGFPSGFNKDDFEDVIDLTTDKIEEFMEGCSSETIDGLKVFAEHGPAIHASLLDDANIENYGHFQGRVTKRARTVTKNKDAFLFAWDDWTKAPDKIGQYAVTQVTYRSLRSYFDLD